MDDLIEISADRAIVGDLLDFSTDSNYRHFVQRIDSPVVRATMISYPMRGANLGCRQVSALMHRHGDVVVELDEVDTLTVVDTYVLRRFPADESCTWHDAGVKELAVGDRLLYEGDPTRTIEQKLTRIDASASLALLTFECGRQLALSQDAVVRRLNEPFAV